VRCEIKINKRGKEKKKKS